MICEKCPYSEEVRGCVNLYRCTQRDIDAQPGHDGCDLVESIKAGNRLKVEKLTARAVDPEEDTVKIDMTFDFEILDDIILEIEHDGFSKW